MNRQWATTILIGALVATALGCSESSSPGPTSSAATSSQPPEPVTQAAAIAVAIQNDPDAAEEILKQHGLTREQFETLLYEIAADPEWSSAYLDLVQ